MQGVILAVTEQLQRDGSQGRLGAVYRLESVTSKLGSEEGLVLRFAGDHVSIPPPDTVVASSNQGDELPAVAGFLKITNPSPGIFLESGGEPAWQILEKLYFKWGEGYGTGYLLEDVSRKTIQALAAYDEQGDGDKRVVGEVTLELPNFLGALRYLYIHWRSLSPVTQTINLVYGEPRILLLPLGFRFSFNQDLKDTLYLQRDIKVQFTSLAGHTWNTALGAGFRELYVTTSGRDRGLVPYRHRNINLAFQRQHFDHPVNPSSGFRVSLAFEGGTVTGTGNHSRAALGRGELEAIWVGSIGWMTLAQEVQAMGLATIDYSPQLADLGRFGGTTTLRGYREDQFLTSKGIISRAELRFRTGSASRIHLFLDTGSLAGFNTPAAVGAGLLFNAGQNLIQLDLAWNREAKFQTGKIHLRLINLLSTRR